MARPLTSIRLVLIALLSLAAFGCAYTAQTVDLTPSFSVAAPRLESPLPINVEIVDERPREELGRRGTGAVRGAAIRPGQPIRSVFENAVVSGLTQLGFEPTRDDHDAERKLRIEVRELEYTATMGVWTGGFLATCAIKAVASNGGGSFEQFYRAEQERRSAFVPSANQNERLITEATNRVLNQLFADPEITAFLASDHKSIVPAVSAPSPAPAGVAERLERLDSLRERGLLSEHEYQSKRTEILNEL